jgi:hypothetical protein
MDAQDAGQLNVIAVSTPERPYEMADIVNLRQARKAKAKQAKEEAAQANRIAFGRTKAEKKLSASELRRDANRLDGHKIEGPADET